MMRTATGLTVGEERFMGTPVLFSEKARAVTSLTIGKECRRERVLNGNISAIQREGAIATGPTVGGEALHGIFLF